MKSRPWRSMLCASTLTLLAFINSGRADTYEWYPPISGLPIPQQIALADLRDNTWDNPANWADSYPVVTGAPGNHEDDIVYIRNIVQAVPHGMHGRVASLNLAGSGARVVGGSIRVWSQLSLDSTAGQFPLELNATVEGTAKFLHSGSNLLEDSSIESAGVLVAGEVPDSRMFGGKIRNLGTIQINHNATLLGALIESSGRIEKTEVDTMAEFSGYVTNRAGGTIEVGSGTLELSSGVIFNEGSLVVSDPAARLLCMGTLIAKEGATASGPGSVQVSYLRMDGPVSFPVLVLGVEPRLIGSTRGNARLTIEKSCRVIGGGAFLFGGGEPSSFGMNLDASPVMEILRDAELWFEAGESLLGRRLENHGRIRIDSSLGLGADEQGKPGVLYNHVDGVIEGLPPGVAYTGFFSGVCTNEGRMVIRGARIGYGQVPFSNSGFIEVADGNLILSRFEQTAGELRVASNALLTAYGPFRATGGILSGSGAIRFNESASIAAIIQPGPGFGRLQLVGGTSVSKVELSSAAMIDLEIGGRTPAVDHDHLALTEGEVATRLNGTLKVRLVGGFVPVLGDSFRVVDYSTSADPGRFTRYDVSALPTGLGWVPEYRTDHLLMVVTNGPPAEPPGVLSAASLDGTRIDICFNEIMDPQTAMDPAHYRIGTDKPGEGIAAVRLRRGGRSVSLVLSTPVTGAFDLLVDGVLDLDLPPRAAHVSFRATVLGFRSDDVGVEGDPFAPGGCFACGDGRFDMEASGSTLYGSSDRMHFVHRLVTGDFDARVKVIHAPVYNSGGPVPPGSATYNSFGALIARESLDAGSRTAVVGMFTDDSNAITGFGRLEPDSFDVDWRTLPPQQIPGPSGGVHWSRLVRRGSLFEGYYSEDGANWTSYVKRDVEWSNSLHVGIGLSAFDNTRITSARFDDFAIETPPPQSVKLTVLARPDSGIIELRWTSPSSADVVIEVADGLEGSSWRDVNADITKEGNTAKAVLPIEPAAGVRLYRLHFAR